MPSAHITSPLKAVPLAVLLAMSPVTETAARDIMSQEVNYVAENIDKTLIKTSPERAHKLLQDASLEMVKELYSASGFDINKINVVERVQCETSPGPHLRRGDIFLIDEDNDKLADRLLVVLQGWPSDYAIGTYVCMPEEIECVMEHPKRYNLKAKTYRFEHVYNRSKDKLELSEADWKLRDGNIKLSDSILLRTLFQVQSD